MQLSKYCAKTILGMLLRNKFATATRLGVRFLALSTYLSVRLGRYENCTPAHHAQASFFACADWNRASPHRFGLTLEQICMGNRDVGIKKAAIQAAKTSRSCRLYALVVVR